MNEPLFPNLSASRFSPVLLTDLYALTMLQAYFEEHMINVAVSACSSEGSQNGGTTCWRAASTMCWRF
jgi:nicotinic acid phosphoribosyltransferase